MRKHLILSFVALILSAGVAFSAPQQGNMGGQGGMGGQMGGQGGRMGGRRGGMTIDQQVTQMKSDLKLTDKQTTQVKALLEKQQKDMQTWRSGHSGATREDMMAHRQEMTTTMNASLKKILTPEQFKKHQEMQQQRMRRGPSGQAPNPQ